MNGLNHCTKIRVLGPTAEDIDQTEVLYCRQHKLGQSLVRTQKLYSTVYHYHIMMEIQHLCKVTSDQNYKEAVIFYGQEKSQRKKCLVEIQEQSS